MHQKAAIVQSLVSYATAGSSFESLFGSRISLFMDSP